VTDTYEIGVEIYVLGIRTGDFYGNLKDGLGITVDLFLAKGKIAFYLKDGKEAWVRIDLHVTFDGSYEKDIKLLTIN
jgi:hypothetical protein